MVVNSGGVDLSSISVIDSDLNLNTNIDLNRTQNYSYSNFVIIDKAASNTNKLFVKTSAVVNAVNYQSNQIQVRIPGYGGPADAIVYAPSSVQTTTDFDTTITVRNMNSDIGQDFTIDYWITNEAETTNYTSGQQTIYVSASGETNLTVELQSPSQTGDYKFKALVSWVKGTASAYDSFQVISTTQEDSSGGGGSIITTKAIDEIVCNSPYIRYSTGCCLDQNNDSICDKEDILEFPEENKTGGTIEETPKKDLKFSEKIKNFTNKVGKFFSLVGENISKNKKYLFIGLGILIIIIAAIFLIKKLPKRKPKDTTSLKSTKGIIVYGADGYKIGKIKEVYLEKKKPKIYGWLIKVDKEIYKKIKKKNILVRHKHIESIKHIMIISKKVSEHLEELDSK